MPANYVLLEKITVGSAGASSVTFSGIPQTGYTDLVVKASARSDYAQYYDYLNIQFNSSGGTAYSARTLYGTGAGAASTSSSSSANITFGGLNGNTATASTFANSEFYIPNYTSSNYKSVSQDGVEETNAASTIFSFLTAGLWSNTAAITTITLSPNFGTNFLANSTFYLYGVAKLGTTPAIVPYATGGDTIMTDGTYWYHAFKSSGTFTPAKGLSCDVLVVAGGGGGGRQMSGGGGAGGLRGLTSQSVTSGTGYTITVGAGGAGAVSGSAAIKGTNSSISGSGFSTITATGGGRGQSNDGTTSTGGNGGSGGGGSGSGTSARLTAGTGNEGGYTPVEGYAGGAGFNGGVYGGGGGGGASAVGSAGTSSTGGAGGAGVSSYSSWGSVTDTGQNVTGTYWFAGGGGGGSESGGAGTGGNGGGGAGSGSTNGTAGTTNTGGGGGGSQNGAFNGGNGGSGIVIIRYAV